MFRLRIVVLASVLFAIASGADLRAEVVERTATIAQLLPPERASEFDAVLDKDRQITWNVFKPTTASTPHGVLVFVSARDSGRPPNQWLGVLQQSNLIWIGANRFGNKKPSAQRILAAILGLALVQRDYEVDPERIYIAGMSGGGRIASKTITTSPQLFTGAIYFSGADFSISDAAQLAAKRIVFVTGSADFNRREMKQVYQQYRDAGLREVLLMDLPLLGHTLPKAKDFERAIRYLDMDH
ncbi:MAG TPA: PHB depolymerase family esterase [Steroidobacteraceae bacterium]|nr:PHB depolymerase family esterase [Steroidobacteraceae bacterium]